MDIRGALEVMGGVASRAQLVAATSRTQFERALRADTVVRVGRGRYADPTADEAKVAAHRITGVVCLESAALLHGWPVRSAPHRPQVCVPRNRRVPAGHAAGMDLVRLDLAPGDHVDAVTSPERTLLDCGRRLERGAALCVVDSALRSGFSPLAWAALARDARGPGSRQLQWLAHHASPLAANPFESALRDLCLDVPGLHVRPQVPIWAGEFLGRPDLVDEDLRIVVEADSFAWHGGRARLAQDARRYNRFLVNGWLVLRFAWEDVMCDPGYVLEMLRCAVEERTERAPGRRRSA